MMKIFTVITLIIFFCSCRVTKSVPEGDALYTGASVSFEAQQVDRRAKKVLTEDLNAMTRPKPNSRFLGIPFKLMIWNLFGTYKNPDSFFGRLGSKWGEPPVLASELDLENNEDILKNYLENKGFFNAEVEGDSTERKRKVSAHYDANGHIRYTISSVAFPQDSSELSQAIRSSAANTLLKTGEPFDLDIIKGERQRINADLKEKGFYYFSPELLLVKADSTEGDHQVQMRVIVKPDAPSEAFKKYYIDDVFIYADYSLNTATVDTNRRNSEYYEGFYIVDPQNKYKPKLFRVAMQFNPGEVYNITDHNRTLNRLINLNVFKFVKNRFEPVTDNDSAKLDVFYYLTPFPKQSLRVELGVKQRSNNLNGSEIRVGYHNRNLLRGGEQFDFRVFTGTDVQFSGAFQGYNTFRAGAEAELGIPRFLVPFVNFNTRSAFMPKTNIQLQYELLRRQKLYNLNSFRTAWGYIWKESQQKTHELYPIAVTYVLPSNLSDTFESDIRLNPSLRHVADTQFILGSTYQYTLNQQIGPLQPINSFYFNGVADVSGNLAGLFAPTSGNNQKKLFSVPFSQYLKFDLDGRYYRKIGLNTTWANRIAFGYGLPYGNSQQLPFIKQFFTGGSNSLRAFRARTVGPGTYKAPRTRSGYVPDQTGDIKLEMNTELRPKISGPLYGAVFVDAGNIWLKYPDPEKPGAAFSKDFLKELAIGAGIGLRLDIQIFVVRFDVAFPIRKPYLPAGQRFVLGDTNFGDPDWRRENIIYNLALGYPF